MWRNKVRGSRPWRERKGIERKGNTKLNEDKEAYFGTEKKITHRTIHDRKAK